MGADLSDKLSLLQLTIEKVGMNTEILKKAIRNIQEVLDAQNKILANLERRVQTLERTDDAVNAVMKTMRES